jgi:dihydrofolate reductase
MSKRTVAAIVAMDEGRVIGRDGALPWHLPEDLAHFKALTSGHVVVMGRKTWESLPPKFRPLPGRVNIVVSRAPQSLTLPSGTYAAGSIDEALSLAERVSDPERIIWIIGGAEVYKAALPLCDELHLTLVSGTHEGDAYLPPFEDLFKEVSSTPTERCAFKVYRKI